MAKISVSKVTILYSEGIPEFVEHFLGEYPSLEVANKALALMAHKAPDDGCYNKTKFRVEWTDGETYEGRIDLKRHDTQHTDIIGYHMRQIVDFEAGRWQPAHMSKEDYARIMAQKLTNNPQHCALYESFRDSYNF